MSKNDVAVKTEFDKAIYAYFFGSISRSKLAELAETLLNQIEEESELKNLLKKVSVWSVKQEESEFSNTRLAVQSYYQSLPDNDEDNSLEENIEKYLNDANYPREKATEDDISELYKKSLREYLNDEISELFVHSIAFHLMFRPPNKGFEFDDEDLMHALDRVSDWNMFWSDEIEYIEPELQLYVDSNR